MRAAGELPDVLWAKVLALVLAEVPWLDEKPFGRATARLRLLLNLAAVSKGLRRAAVAAGQAQPLISMSADPQLPPHYLSRALAGVAGRLAHLNSGNPLLASPEAAAFLETACVDGLRADFSGSDAAAAEAMGDQAAGWVTVGRLVWICQQAPLLPGSLPPCLDELIVRFQCDAGPAAVQELFTELSACPSVTRLELDFHAKPAALPQGLPWPASLERLRLSFGGPLAARQLDLGLLRQVDTTAVKVVLRASKLGLGSLQRLLRSVPPGCHLDQLELVLADPMPPAAQLALGAITTRLTYIHSPLFEVLSHQVLSHLPAAQHRLLALDIAAVSWTALSAPGTCTFLADGPMHRLLDVTVQGCTGVMPDHVQPWAVFVRDWDSVRGLPRKMFERLPSGWWVWQNGASAELGLQEPVELEC